MNRLIKNIPTFLVLASIILAGIFCYQGIQQMDKHCSSDSSSVLCGDILLHGTITSQTIFSSIFILFFVLILFTYLKPVFKLIKIDLKRFLYLLNSKERIPTLNPFQVAISKGIIHPKRP